MIFDFDYSRDFNVNQSFDIFSLDLTFCMERPRKVHPKWGEKNQLFFELPNSVHRLTGRVLDGVTSDKSALMKKETRNERQWERQIPRA